MINDDKITSRCNWNAQAYRAYLSCEHLKNSAESRELFLERYRGEWNSEEAFAQDCYGSCYDMNAIPEGIKDHIDWGSVASELFAAGVYSDDSNDRGIFVFDNC